MVRTFSFRAPMQQRTFSARTCARTGAHVAQRARSHGRRRAVGLRVALTEDRTASVVTAAKGRLVAPHRYRAELERIESVSGYRVCSLIASKRPHPTV
jgi:hypothetical protein